MRHRFSTQPLSLKDAPILAEIKKAEDLGNDEKWILGAEILHNVATTLEKANKESVDAAILFTRAACYFEYALQYKDAGESYNAAAGICYRGKVVDGQTMGELYARAAACFMRSKQFFFAGTALRSSADSFLKIPTSLVSITDAIPPLPMAANKETMAGSAYDASAESYLEAKQIGWASGSRWLAGKAAINDPIGVSIGAVESLRDAIILAARYYKSVTPENLRNSLPLTNEERKEQMNPIEFLQEKVRIHYKSHQTHNNETAKRYEGNPQFNFRIISDSDVERDVFVYMSSFFKDLYFELRDAANGKEASEFYVKLKNLERAEYWRTKGYSKWLGRFLWGITCEYGENMGRWVLVSLGLFLFFALTYAVFDLIEPVTSWVDYPYFSVITLTSLGYGDIHPKGWLGKMVACFEIISGLLMFGMLVTLFSKRLIRE